MSLANSIVSCTGGYAICCGFWSCFEAAQAESILFARKELLSNPSDAFLAQPCALLMALQEGRCGVNTPPETANTSLHMLASIRSCGSMHANLSVFAEGIIVLLLRNHESLCCKTASAAVAVWFGCLPGGLDSEER